MSVEHSPNRREVVVGCALGAAGLGGLAIAPRAETRPLANGALERLVPKQIGPWRFATIDGVIVPPSDDQQGSSYDQVLVRSYRASGLPDMMLLVAYGSGEHGLSQVHRPEACYPAFGFSMANRRPLTLPVTAGRVVPATFYTARSNERIEQLIYWTRVGSSFPTTWRGQTIDLALANLRGIAPDGVLVRVSTVMSNPAGAISAMVGFHASIMGALSPAGRLALTGVA